MKLKVCGMREVENVMEVSALQPDFMGFIFYDKSPRYVAAGEAIAIVPEGIKKMGVFVNASEEKILEEVKAHNLDFVQLHGSETPALASSLKQKGVAVIKVMSVTDELPVKRMSEFEGIVDYFLFDTKTPEYGGSGKKFEWKILEQYPFTTPFFLSGGIGVDDIEEIKALEMPSLYAIDVNSRFELKPGLKDIEKLKELKTKL